MDIREWANEDIAEIDSFDAEETTLLVRDLHGFLIALETYEDATDAIDAKADTAFADFEPVCNRCQTAHEELDTTLDHMTTNPSDQVPHGTEDMDTSDTVIRNLLANPTVATDGLYIDKALQPPASEIGQLYRTELEVTDPEDAGDIYDSAMQMVGAVHIGLDALESFIDFHPGGTW